MTTGRTQESGHFGLVMIELANRRLAGGAMTSIVTTTAPPFPFSLHPTWPLKRPTSTFPPSSSSSPIHSLTFPKLVVRPPKGIRNKAPRGRAADPTGLAIRLSLPHFRGAGTRLYGPNSAAAAEGGRRRRWWNGHLPGPLCPCADEFATVFQGTSGEDAGNARICD